MGEVSGDRLTENVWDLPGYIRVILRAVRRGLSAQRRAKGTILLAGGDHLNKSVPNLPGWLHRYTSFLAKTKTSATDPPKPPLSTPLRGRANPIHVWMDRRLMARRVPMRGNWKERTSHRRIKMSCREITGLRYWGGEKISPHSARLKSPRLDRQQPHPLPGSHWLPYSPA